MTITVTEHPPKKQASINLAETAEYAPTYQESHAPSEHPMAPIPVIEKESAKEEQEKPKKQKTIKEFIYDYRSDIQAALPKHLTADRMLRITMTEIRKNPDLEQCTMKSLISSVIQCSQLGLEPGGILQHAYLIPFNRKIKDKNGRFTEVKECQFVVGYRGMLDLTRRSGQVAAIGVRVVYSNDHFEYSYGLDERCYHVPAVNDRGEMIGCYVVVKFKDGAHQFEYMNRTEINNIRDKSVAYSNWVKYGKSGKSPIWEEHYEEMAKKTVVRRMFKYLPVSIEIQKAVIFDEAGEIGQQDSIFDDSTDLPRLDARQSKSDALADKLAGQ